MGIDYTFFYTFHSGFLARKLYYQAVITRVKIPLLCTQYKNIRFKNFSKVYPKGFLRIQFFIKKLQGYLYHNPGKHYFNK